MRASEMSPRKAAMYDPGYHRYLMFGQADAHLAKQWGRPLQPHEMNGRLRGPQLEIIRRVERAVVERKGEILTVLQSRQTGKNEIAAMLQARALVAHEHLPGSTWIRTAPTHKPQIVISRSRARKMLDACPFARKRWRSTEGYIYELGEARVEFMSSGKTANVVGATASLCLDVDEAHKVDAGKYGEDLSPFTASTNAPTVMWGVAADRQDLLHEWREYNRERHPDRLLEFPASVWCELIPVYADHYEARRAKYGADHPFILTQYDLVAIDAMAGYLNSFRRAALFSGEHHPLEGPRDGYRYIALLDVGGDSENEPDSVEVGSESQDVSWLHILEWDPAARFAQYPETRIVAMYRWVGESHETVVLPAVCRLLEHWQPSSGVADARGVGEAMAMSIARRFPSIQPYKATAGDVSEDCYDLLARLTHGAVRCYRAEDALDPLRRELGAQARHTQYQIRGHELMRIVKPTGTGSTRAHIDALKALTYLHRGVYTPGVGAGVEDDGSSYIETGELSPFGRRDWNWGERG